MINGNINNSPVRQVKGKVELYNGSTLLNTFTYRDRLKSFTIERVGEDSKFFGFGVCQKANIKLIDKDRELEITTSHSFKAFLTTGEEYISAFPTFYVTEVHRDENTNELSITAYDALYWASGADLGNGYTNAALLNEYLQSAVEGLKVVDVAYDTDLFSMSFPDGVSIEGTEKSKEILDDIAEVSQTIYYINNEDILVFKRLDINGLAALTIGKADYIKLDSKTNRRLTAICRATELGDDVSTPMEITGTTQYIRDNVFLENMIEIQSMLDNAIAALGGMLINQFDCSWRGNFLLEPGDKIDLVTKDNNLVTSYVLNDSIEYNGSLSQRTKWQYTEDEAAGDNHYNPTTLGESLKQTFARVDKANKKITQLVSESTETSSSISQLQTSVGEINGTVTTLQQTTAEALGGLEEDVATLSQSVEAKITDEEVSIKISEALSNGVDKVETSTGFTFDDVGLTISKTDAEMSTTITEDGMIVYKNDDAVLTANNIGVEAVNLTAKTYLIIGTNSRFEDYGTNRTGCFWIGG